MAASAMLDEKRSVLTSRTKHNGLMRTTESSTNAWRGMDELARLALAFFTATTKCSNDNEDILPQEDSDEMKLLKRIGGSFFYTLRDQVMAADPAGRV